MADSCKYEIKGLILDEDTREPLPYVLVNIEGTQISALTDLKGEFKLINLCHEINTITIVMNNKSWGAEKAYQRDYYNKRYVGADISSPPFHELAELYGAKGYHITQLKDVKKTIKDALVCNKPVIINVEVDPKALYSFRKDSFKHRAK